MSFEKKYLAVNLSQGKNVASHSLATELTEEKRGGERIKEGLPLFTARG